jgi:predicted dinucleotide-binding enzyme
MTSIAVLGAGNIGATLARKWAARGHQVTLARRDPDATKLRDLATEIGATTMSHALGTNLDGKVIVGTTNNVGGVAMNNLAGITQTHPQPSP